MSSITSRFNSFIPVKRKPSTQDVIVRVINLERSKGRLESFRKTNPHLNIKRFAAVDAFRYGRQYFLDQELIAPENQYELLLIGNAASHVSFWRKCAAGKDPFHIAEDDAIFHGSFPRKIPELLGKLKDWDIVFWGWNFDHPVEIRYNEVLGSTMLLFDQYALRGRISEFYRLKIDSVLVPLASCAGICAYSISPRGARNYLNRVLPISNAPLLYPPQWGVHAANEGLDIEMSRHHAFLGAYVCMPPLAVTPNDHSASTVR